MNIEVGMYVRTENGKIWLVTSTKAIDGHKRRIVKASHIIIDLICVGDYVNGYKIVDIKQDYITGRLFLLTEKWETNWQGDRSLVTFYDEDICSVVTKEQFEAMAYRIGE